MRREAAMASTCSEVELLLLCARTRVDSEIAGRVETLLKEDIDWNYVLEIAGRHGVMPLLYWNLNAICPEAVPKPILDQLREYFQRNAQINMLMAGELLKLLNLFKANGISAVPYKGPALAATIYGNLALRPRFLDLDILVREQDVLKAKDLLLSQGYRPGYELTPRQEMVLLQASHEYPFVNDDNKVAVELHWKITSRHFSFSLDHERLWKRVEPRRLAGEEVLTFSPEDLLLILCVHGAKHCWRVLEWICGVAELIRTNESLKWTQVIDQAKGTGSERMLFLGLFLASDLLGASLPGDVAQRVKADLAVRALAVQVREQLFRKADSPPGPLDPKSFKKRLFHLRARERLQDRVRHCMHLVVSPTPWDWGLSLPAALFLFNYVLRPIRLIGKFAPDLLRRSP